MVDPCDDVGEAEGGTTTEKQCRMLARSCVPSSSSSSSSSIHHTSIHHTSIQPILDVYLPAPPDKPLNGEATDQLPIH
eukprot:6586258-Prymnesium_polylepis.1